MYVTMWRLTVFIAAVSTASCGISETIYFPLDAGTDGDVGTDAGDAGTEIDAGEPEAGNFCGGQCVAFRPLGGWSDPILVWLGPRGASPGCPSVAPELHFTKYAELSAPPAACDACICKPSIGKCSPSSTFTAQSTLCKSPDPITTSFDAPADWDGACTQENPVAAGALCDGAPCVRSLSIGPLAVIEESCEPALSEIPKADFAPPTWAQEATVCEGLTDTGHAGCGSGAMCIPEPVPPVYRACVYKEGDVPCEGEHYTERHVLFGDFDDQRSCTPCGCGPVSGSVCTATASIYTDAACTVALLGGVPASSLDSPCFDLTPAGEALGSKAMTNIKYHAGACEATGGEPQGAVVEVLPATFCCIPQDK